MTDAIIDLLIREKYKGSFKAIVDDIQDPKKLRRIRAFCPSLSKNEPLGWATPKDGKTDEWLPKKGDIVWIEFEGWDVDYPIWTGRCPAKDDVSDDFKNNYGHDYRVDRDYNGNKVEWKTTGMIVTDKNGNKTTMDQNGTVTEDLSGNKTTSSSSGIKMEDCNGNVFEMTSSGMKMTDCNGNVFDMKSGKISINGTNHEVDT